MIQCLSMYLIATLIASGVGSYMVAQDKRIAKQNTGAMRIPESALLAAALFFGWPGVVFSMLKHNHKVNSRNKGGFQTKLYFISGGHIVLVVVVLLIWHAISSAFALV